MEKAKYFLALGIAQTTEGIYVNQRKYTLDIIANLGIMGSKTRLHPINKGIKLSVDPINETLCDPEKYRHLIGRLLYLNFTRTDIAYSVQQLSQYVNKPYITHWNAAIQVAKYLKGTPSRGIFFPSNNDLTIQAFSYSDWGSCVDSENL